MSPKQVPKQHYEFSSYVTKRRWASIWHQIDEVLVARAASVLEIGPGPGIFKAATSALGVHVETVDLDEELNPDHVAMADHLPFAAKTYDAVCAFQMLEHVPYPTSLTIFSEMARVARLAVIISLPDARPAWPYSLHIPLRGDLHFFVPRPTTGPKEHVFNGEHYWEINKKGYSLKKVSADLCAAGNVKLQKTYRVKQNPYHRFLVFRSDIQNPKQRSAGA